MDLYLVIEERQECVTVYPYSQAALASAARDQLEDAHEAARSSGVTVTIVTAVLDAPVRR